MCIFLTVICRLFTILVTRDATKPCVWAFACCKRHICWTENCTHQMIRQHALACWIIQSSSIFPFSQLGHAAHRLRGQPRNHCDGVRQAFKSAYYRGTLALEAGARRRYISSIKISTGLLLRLVQGMESVSCPRCPGFFRFICHRGLINKITHPLIHPLEVWICPRHFFSVAGFLTPVGLF